MDMYYFAWGIGLSVSVWLSYTTHNQIKSMSMDIEEREDYMLKQTIKISNRLQRLSSSTEFYYNKHEKEMSEHCKDFLHDIQQQTLDCILIIV